MAVKYKRILLKLSEKRWRGKGPGGLTVTPFEPLGKQFSVDPKVSKPPSWSGAAIFGGENQRRYDRVTADHIGMLGTAMNALALSDALEQAGCVTRVLSAVEMRQFCEPYIRKRAIRHLEKGRVVIFACGTGHPFFSTDTAAALRASEIEADIILKATVVDGVYDKDPKKHCDAVRYKTVSHDEVLRLSLGIMDATAAALCRDNRVAIAVFDISDPQNIIRIVDGDGIGTIIS